MIALLDLIAVLAVCLTTIVCFVIRASRGTDVDELAEHMDELKNDLERDRATVADLTKVTTTNAKTFENFRADVRTRLQLGPK